MPAPATRTRPASSSLHRLAQRAAAIGLVPLALACATQPAAAQCEPSLIYHDGGDPVTLGLRGDYLYASYPGELRISDVSNPAAPVVVAKLPVPGRIADIHFSGNYLYGAAGDAGLIIVDITAPAAPALASVELIDGATRVTAASNIAMVVANGDVDIYDVTDPTAPIFRSTHTMLGSVRDVGIQGTTGYTMNVLGDLDTLNLANLSVPIVLDSYESTVGSIFEQLARRGNTLAMLSWDGVDIVDVSNPSAVTHLSTIVVDGIVQHIDFGSAAGQALLHFEGDASDLKTYDLTNPAAPVLRASVPGLTFLNDIAALGDMTYIINADDILAYDFAVPASPVLLKTTEPTLDTLGEIVISGNHAILGSSGQLQIINVANPLSPGAPLSFPAAGFSINSLKLVGNRLFVASSSATGHLEVYNVTNPTTPVLMGGLTTPVRIVSMDVIDQKAYVVDASYTVTVIDVANPASMTTLGSVAVQGNDRLFAWNGFVFVASFSPIFGGVQVINAQNPAAPFVVSSLSPRPGNSLYAFAMRGPLAFVGQSDLRVDIMDMSDPINPLFRSQFISTGGISSFGVVETMLLVNDRSDKLNFIDTADPDTPTYVRGAYIGGSPPNFARRGNTLWASGFEGLFGITLPGAPRFSQLPQDAVACPGTPSLSFSVALSSSAAAAYQWNRNGVPLANGAAGGGATISGANTPTLTITNPGPLQLGDFSCTTTTLCGASTCEAASLTAAVGLTILQQPVDQKVCPGGTAQFEIAGLGTLPAIYQWQGETSPGVYSNVLDTASAAFTITGATSRELTIAAVAGQSLPGSVARRYRCVASNVCNSVTSNPARLVICRADFNCSGVVSVQDIFDFLGAYFSSDPRADFNNSGAISVQDIFDFLAAYFAGCP